MYVLVYLKMMVVNVDLHSLEVPGQYQLAVHRGLESKAPVMFELMLAHGAIADTVAPLDLSCVRAGIEIEYVPG